VTLFIVHYHLRPGGIRRVIELATPHLVRHSPQTVTRVVLVTGCAADKAWHEQFARQLREVTVEIVVEPSFNYLSEQDGTPGQITKRIRAALNKLFAESRSHDCLVWAHNLGVGRNLIVARELSTACARRSIPLVSHHHDWWFDNRWSRWAEMQRAGFRTLAATARAVFPPAGKIIHAAINRADAKVLTDNLGKHACWLPNLTERLPPPPEYRIRTARYWLQKTLKHGDAPVWLLPCRTLRRKNIAEALLLTRWLRPDAWLIVTGGASSADELPYLHALVHAARAHKWPLRLGVLAGKESRKPSVNDLFAASEATLLTSVQEGFGLPYLEAGAARRPLIARRLMNIAPDLDRFGFRFPQAYDEILVAPGLFNWADEFGRQRKLFKKWIATMPASLCARVPTPHLLATSCPQPIAFSRLTLRAQLEVLAKPITESWLACAPLNPFLEGWRRRAELQKLRVSPWPSTASDWLSGEAYARRFHRAVQALRSKRTRKSSATRIQADFIRLKLDVRNLHPILWSQSQ